MKPPSLFITGDEITREKRPGGRGGETEKRVEREGGKRDGEAERESVKYRNRVVESTFVTIPSGGIY